jgi:hypothetical protein
LQSSIYFTANGLPGSFELYIPRHTFAEELIIVILWRFVIRIQGIVPSRRGVSFVRAGMGCMFEKENKNASLTLTPRSHSSRRIISYLFFVFKPLFSFPLFGIQTP